MNLISISAGLEDDIFNIDKIVNTKVEIDFKNDFSYVEIPNAYIEEISYREQLTGETGFGIANTFRIVFNNKYKWFTDTRFGTYDTDFSDPENVNLNGTQQSDGFGYLRPGIRVRVSFTVGVGNEWIQRLTGFVDMNGFKERIKEASNNVVTIGCVDRAKTLIDEPLEDENGGFSCYINKKYCDPDDTENSLIHIIAANANLHHWFDSVVVTGGTTCTVTSTAGLEPGMIMSGTGITGTIKIDSITNSTVFEIDTAVSNSTYNDWEATLIEGQKVSMEVPYAPLLESCWKEMCLLAEALHGTVSFDHEGLLYFGDSRYGDAWVEPTTEEDTIDNDFFNNIDKSQIFSDRKNIVKITFDKPETLSEQNLFTFPENYSHETGRCNLALKGKVINNVQSGSTTTSVKLDAADIQATGYYAGYEIEIDSEVREILEYNGTTNICTVVALSSDPTGKAYEITPGNPIVSKILEYAALYDVAIYNPILKKSEAGHAVIYTEDVDATPTVEYTMSGTTYTAFDDTRLKLVSYDITTYPDRAIIRLKNNNTSQINLTSLKIRGKPTVLAKRYTYGEVGDTASKDNAGYIGKKREDVDNKYFTDEIKYSTKQYMDWVAYRLDYLKDPVRIYNLSTVRPVIHYQCGALIKIQETLTGTGIDVKCRLESISAKFKRGKASITLGFREAFLGFSRAPDSTPVASDPGGSSSNARAASNFDDQFISYDEGQEGYTSGGGTKTPTQVTVLEARAVGVGGVMLIWDKQLNLTNLDHYEVQVTDDEISWYSLKFDGTDWKDILSETTDVNVEMLVHTRIPHAGTTESPVGRTLKYRIRRVTKAEVEGTWSATATVTTNTVENGDIAANTVYANSLVASVLNSIIANISTQLTVGGDGFLGLSYGDTSGYQEAGLSDKDFTLETGLSASTTYYWKLNIDGGGESEYSITTDTDTRFKAVIDLMNAEVEGAMFNLTDGDLRCKANSDGDGSTIALSTATLTGTSLFDTLTDFSSFDTAVAGATGVISHGASRVRIDRNELIVESWTGSAWEMVARICGEVDNQFFPFIQTRGIVKDGATDEAKALPIGVSAPDGVNLYEFEDNLEDQDGTDPWNIDVSTDYATGKFGSKALCADVTTADGVLGIINGGGIDFNGDWVIDTWARIGESVPFKKEILRVNQQSGVRLSASFGSEHTTNISTDSMMRVAMIDPTHCVVTFKDTGNGNKGTARVGVISSNTTITYGAESVFYDYSMGSYLEVRRLSATKVVVMWKSSTILYAIVGTVSGNSITFGTAVSIKGSNYAYYPNVAVLSDTRFVVCFADVGPSHNYNTTSVVCNVDGTTITKGSDYTTTSQSHSQDHGICKLDEDRFCVTYSGASANAFAIVGVISNDDEVSYGTEVTVFAGQTTNASIMCSEYDGDLVLAVYAKNSDSKIYAKLLTISSDDSISVGSETSAFNTNALFGYLGICKMTNNDIAVSYRENVAGSTLMCIVAYEDRNGTLNVGSPQTIVSTTHVSPKVSALEDYGNGVVVYGGGRSKVFTVANTKVVVSIEGTDVTIKFINATGWVYETITKELDADDWFHIYAAFDHGNDNLHIALNGDSETIDTSLMTLNTGACQISFLMIAKEMSDATAWRFDDLLIDYSSYSLTPAESLDHYGKNLQWIDSSDPEKIDLEKDLVLVGKTGGRVLAKSWTENVLLKSANYTVLDTDGSCIIFVTTGSSTITITLPTVADNIGKTYKIIKTDSGSGKVVIDGEGAEEIYNREYNFTTIEIWYQYDFIEVTPNGGGTAWVKTNAPYLHIIPESDRSTSPDVYDASVSTSWESKNLSSLVPPGTIGLHGQFNVQSNNATNERHDLWIRGSGSAANRYQNGISRFAADLNSGAFLLSSGVVTFLSKNGQFESREEGGAYLVQQYSFTVWGYLL